MQTFLTRVGWYRSLKDLDPVRLNKQVLEAYQILRVLRGGSDGYHSHPAVNMWREHPRALAGYGLAAAWVYWKNTGKGHACGPKIKTIYQDMCLDQVPPNLPLWRKDEWLIRSHRSNLIRKDPDTYSALFPNTPPLMPYLWPKTDHEDDRGRGDAGPYRLSISIPDLGRLRTGDRILPPELEVDEINRKVYVR